MRNRNLWVILIAVLLIVAALVVAAVLPAHRHQFAQSQDTVLLPDSQEQGGAEEPTAEPTKEPTAAPTSTPTKKPAASPTVTVAESPTPQATAAASLSETAGISVTETPSATAAVSTPLPDVKAYLLVTVRGLTYQPIPLYEEHDYTIRQQDGSENVIHVTADSVSMKSSTCENQDCVQQGTVTVDNYKERILYNMILCLPNQVYLELYTPEDLAALLAQWAAEDAQAEQ